MNFLFYGNIKKMHATHVKSCVLPKTVILKALRQAS